MKRGVSLGEAIVAIFLILASVMVTVTLFHSGMRYGSTSERRLMAAVFGRKVMQEIRVWARDPGNFDSDWAAYNGLTLTDPDYPGAEAVVRCDFNGRQMFGPCSELESMYTSPKTFDRSVIPVEVTVDWGAPGREVRLMSLVGEPEKNLPPVPQVTVTRTSGPSDPIPELQEVEFSAELRDSVGDPIRDVVFYWTLKPVTGNGTLLQNTAPRDGSTMRLRHEYTWNPLMTPPGRGPISGQVQVEVLCRYRGREIVNAPLFVQLQ